MKKLLALLLLLNLSFGLSSSVARAAESSCAGDSTRIQGLVENYFVATYLQHDKEANQIFSAIETLLDGFQQKDPCFQQVAQAYAEASLNQIFTVYIGTDGARYLKKFSEAGKVIYLKHGSRNDASEFSLGDSIGGYDCADTKIYLDIGMKPLDLAATIYHELDHFIRDKMLTEVPQIFIRSNGEIDWATYNLADEAAAISSSVEVMIAENAQTVVKHLTKDQYDGCRAIGNYSRSMCEEGFPRNQQTFTKRYITRNDSSLFSHSGVIDHFWGLNQTYTPSEISRGLFNPTSVPDAAKDFQSEKSAAFRENFFSIVFSTYFPGESLPLSGTAPFSHFFDSSYLTGIHFPMFSDNELHLKNDDELERMIHSPASAVCRLYLDSVTRGQVDHYLGLKYSKTGHVRPCLNFNKTL